MSDNAKVNKIINDNEENDNNKKTNKLIVELRIIGYKGSILNKDIEFNSGDTVKDILKKALDSEKISYRISSDYVSMIDGQRQRDKGTLSGWRYSVNRKFPSKSIGDYKVKENDSIKFIFAKNPNDDEGIVEEDDNNNNDSGTSGGNHNHSDDEYEDTILNEDDTKIVIVRTNGGKVLIENSKLKNENVSIILYDESGYIEYMNVEQIKEDGKIDFNTFLKTGTYYGYINSLVLNKKVEIDKFKVKQ
nr:DUF4430 domain-containing protein [Clostridium aestuarii]